MQLRQTVKPYRKALLRQVRKGDHKVVVVGKAKAWSLAVMRKTTAYFVRHGFPTQKSAVAYSRHKYQRDATVTRATLILA